MKHFVLFWFALCLIYNHTNFSYSQITINSSHKPAIGDTLELRTVDSTGIDFGAGGANQTWNYSNIQILSDVFYERFMQPSSTPYYNNFPNSNLASINSESPPMYHYYNTSGNDWILNGFVQSGNIVTYLDPVTVMHYPLSYGSEFTDTNYASGIGGSFTYYYSGIRTVTCDGYGTLILPGITYNNTLRLKIVYEVYDTVKMGGIVVYTEHILMTYYDWYVEYQKFPVYIILEYISNRSPYYLKRPSITYRNPVVGIKRFSDKIPGDYMLFQNYPNPFNPTTKIKFLIKNAGFVSLKVFDVLGKEIAVLVNEKLKAGEYEVPFLSNSFSGGLYFYSLETDNFKSTKKMMIVK